MAGSLERAAAPETWGERPTGREDDDVEARPSVARLVRDDGSALAFGLKRSSSWRPRGGVGETAVVGRRV